MEASVNTVCLNCGQSHSMKAWTSIDVSREPSLKEKVLNGQLFTWTCPICGKVNLVKYPLMYHDPSQKLLLVLSDTALKVEDMPEGYVLRRVRSIGELVEKIKISDAGLDDVVMEMCKYVARKELGNDSELRFLKLEGPDNDIILTYPDKDSMQMISLGFNVYEDSMGIVSRHGAMKPEGLQTVDASWMAELLA